MNRELTDREKVLVGILHDQEELYGLEIRDRYEARTGKAIALGSLYLALNQLEVEGVLTSRMGDTGPDRDGNRKKFYRLRDSGAAELLLR